MGYGILHYSFIIKVCSFINKGLAFLLFTFIINFLGSSIHITECHTHTNCGALLITYRFLKLHQMHIKTNSFYNDNSKYIRIRKLSASARFVCVLLLFLIYDSDSSSYIDRALSTNSFRPKSIYIA